MSTLTPTKTKPKRKSSKGALIKGMSQRLPIELLDEPAFVEGLRNIMRGYSGIYLLYRKNTLYYVGLAKNLYGRLRGHTRNKHRGKWNHFAFFRVGRVRYLKDIETLLLLVASPSGNAVSGHFHRDADLTQVLRRISQDQTRRVAKYRRLLKR